MANDHLTGVRNEDGDDYQLIRFTAQEPNGSSETGKPRVYSLFSLTSLFFRYSYLALLGVVIIKVRQSDPTKIRFKLIFVCSPTTWP